MDVEHHQCRMASSSTQNLSQFMLLPLVECKYCRIRLVWFKSKANNIIYKCPNNHQFDFSSPALIQLISSHLRIC
jgi:hypothetical protein